MKIIIRKVDPYKDVTIQFENLEYSFGLLDETECKELAEKLKEASEELNTEPVVQPELAPSTPCY